MPTAEEYFRQAEECAALASKAQWPETRDVWRQVERLYLVLARQEQRLSASVHPWLQSDVDRS
jgi:hypothetical protein